MQCKIEDCFNCPYTDCINEKPLSDYVYSDEQKRRYYEHNQQRRKKCRENGICSSCMKRPASDGYKTCFECRERMRKWKLKHDHELGRHTARELMDGVSLCKICGHNPPVDGRVLCERCLNSARKNIAKSAPQTQEKYQNCFRKNIEKQWIDFIQKER